MDLNVCISIACRKQLIIATLLFTEDRILNIKSKQLVNIFCFCFYLSQEKLNELKYNVKYCIIQKDIFNYSIHRQQGRILYNFLTPDNNALPRRNNHKLTENT